MRVGMIQPNYIPWRGYFDFIDDVDVFVFYDDVPYGQGKKWRNRNVIKTRDGIKWLTVPICHGQANTSIYDVLISGNRRWQDVHMNQLEANYRKAPYWHEYADHFYTIINRDYLRIADLDIELCRWIMSVLGIDTQLMRSHDLAIPTGDKTERPVNLLYQIGASTYVTGPNTEPYTDVQLFRSHGIRVEFKSYDYLSYPQLWGGDFAGNVSVLDLLFNTGPLARQYLKSRMPNRTAQASA